MKKKFKLLSLIAIGSALCFGVTALSIASPSIFKPLEYQQRNGVINSSITFNNFKNVDGVGQCVSSLENGGTARAYSTRSLSNGDVVVSSTQFVFFAYVNNGETNKNLTIADATREVAEFQSLSSIKIAYSGTGGMTINYSSDGTSWSSTTSSSNVTNSAISGAKYIYLSTASGTSYVTSIIVNYSCNAEGGGDDPEPSGLTGTYTFSNYSGSVAQFTFNDGQTATYTVIGYDSVSVSYTISGTSLSFTLLSGDNTNLGNYRLFDGSSTLNSTGVIVDDSTFKVNTYGLSSLYNNKTRTFAKE